MTYTDYRTDNASWALIIEWQVESVHVHDASISTSLKLSVFMCQPSDRVTSWLGYWQCSCSVIPAAETRSLRWSRSSAFAFAKGYAWKIPSGKSSGHTAKARCLKMKVKKSDICLFLSDRCSYLGDLNGFEQSCSSWRIASQELYAYLLPFQSYSG